MLLKFWSLASSQRREIMQRLNLLTQEDMRLPEQERYRGCLLRAAEQGILGRVVQAVNELVERSK